MRSRRAVGGQLREVPLLGIAAGRHVREAASVRPLDDPEAVTVLVGDAAALRIFQFPGDAVLLSAVQESDRPALMYSQLPSRRATRPPVICHSLT
jgi:hypothetical protein